MSPGRRSSPLGDAFHVFDTTLRDGAQREGITYSVADKIAVATLLDELGVGFIEGGWPGAMPKDTEFFARALAGELDLRTAQLVAFGATRKAGIRAEDDPQVKALLDSGARVITLVAKSDVRHVERALRTTPEENLAMVYDTVRLLVDNGRRVFLDCEHFFDGYLFDRDYGVRVQEAAVKAGADVVVMCDTNGGMLPMSVERIVGEVRDRTGFRLGIHCQDDTSCAVANTVAAVQAGATHVQCTANGYGERAGNADLFAVVGNLMTKMGLPVLPEGALADMMRVSHALAELANITPNTHQAYVGSSAFSHKAGLARLRDQGRSRAVQPPGPDQGRQRHAHPDHRDGRPGLGGTQGPRARRRPVRAPGGGRPDRRHREVPGGAGLVVRGRRCELRTAGAGRDRHRGRPMRRRRGRSGSSPTASSSKTP